MSAISSHKKMKARAVIEQLDESMAALRQQDIPEWVHIAAFKGITNLQSGIQSSITFDDDDRLDRELDKAEKFLGIIPADLPRKSQMR